MWYHLGEVMLHGKNPDSINVGAATRIGEILQMRSTQRQTGKPSEDYTLNSRRIM
jgi:hypothetical protein